MKKSDMTIGVNSSNFSKDRKMTGELRRYAPTKRNQKCLETGENKKSLETEENVSRNKIKLKVSRNRRNYRYIESVKK